jgi:hypothetical protein
MLYRLYYTFLHRTHKYIPQGRDSFGSKTLILDVCRHVAVCIVNMDIQLNFNQECINIVMAIIPIYDIYRCYFMF